MFVWKQSHMVAEQVKFEGRVQKVHKYELEFRNSPNYYKKSVLPGVRERRNEIDINGVVSI